MMRAWLRVISFSTVSTETAYFHKQKALASRASRSNIAFTGAAMLQKERANKALSARVWKEKSGSPQGRQEDTNQRESSQVARTLVAGR
jgi:hypothetical protein